MRKPYHHKNQFNSMMKLKKFSNLVFFTVAFIFYLIGSSCSGNDPVIFPAPEGMEPSKDYSISVNGQQVFCYSTWRLDNINKTTRVNGRPVSPVSFAIFDFSRPVKIRLDVRDGLIPSPEQVRILPSALNIVPVINGNTIEFTLNSPGNVTIDPSGDSQNALHLFTNFPETDIPSPDDPKVVYFGPGVHDIESVVLESGQTLYIAGGAVLRASPPPTGKKGTACGMQYDIATPAIQLDKPDVSVRGRGIISGNRAYSEMKRFNMIRSELNENITIRDVVVIESPIWAVVFDECSNVRVDGLRVLNFFENSDGILASGSSDVTVQNSFVHNADDGLEIKAWKPVKNIRFENCQVWSDSGTPMGLTGEIFAPVENAVWKGITVLHYPSFPTNAFTDGRAAILIRARGGGKVQNILFEDILVESNVGRRPAVRITNEKVNWNRTPKDTDTPYSEISNVTLRNVVMQNFSHPETSDRLLFVNDTEESIIYDIFLENVVINGKPVVVDDARIENLNSQIIVR